MIKNISVVANISEPQIMKSLVETARKNARYERWVQFIFFIDPANKEAKNMAHELYQKYPPDIFEDPIPTIKSISNENESTWKAQCFKKTDAAHVVFYCEEGKRLFDIENWDMKILDGELPTMTIRSVEYQKKEITEP